MTACRLEQVRRTSRRDIGSAAVEFAITAPLLIALALGVADYGAMTAHSSTLAAYARAGAEYARAQIIAGNGIPPASGSASIASVLNFPLGVSVTYAATDPYCTCANGTSVTCPGTGGANPCAANADPRLLQYVSITATESFTPWISYASYAPLPSSLSSTTVMRVQ